MARKKNSYLPRLRRPTPQVLRTPVCRPTFIDWLIDSFIFESALKLRPLKNRRNPENIWQYFPNPEVILWIFSCLYLFVFSGKVDKCPKNNTTSKKYSPELNSELKFLKEFMQSDSRYGAKISFVFVCIYLDYFLNNNMVVSVNSPPRSSNKIK